LTPNFWCFSKLKIRQIYFLDNEFSHVRDIRKAVFENEMGIPESEVFDEFDIESDHFLFLEQHQIIGAVRLRQIKNCIKLERMAIYQKFRQKEFGQIAVKQIYAHYKGRNLEKIILDSIYDVRNFYKKCGFIEVGEIFDRVRLPHIMMELSF